MQRLATTISVLSPQSLATRIRYGITYEPLKYGFAILLILSLTLMWFQRGFLLDSYQTEQEQVSINLRGVDLEVKKTDIGESPFHIDQAPDTAKNPISLAFADNENQEVEEVELKGGEATIGGTVLAGTEPISGAVVRIERHTNDGSISQDIRATSNGRWSISKVLGGRYRIRAWVPGRYMMDSSAVLYVEDESSTSLELQLREVESSVELDVFSGGPIYQGLTGSAVISVTQRTVDSEGYITTQPVAGKLVEVTAQSPLSLLSSPQVLTNARGESTVKVRCNRIGAARILVKMDDQLENVTLSPCVAIPPPPTTAPPTTPSPTTPVAPGVPGPAPATTTPPGG